MARPGNTGLQRLLNKTARKRHAGRFRSKKKGHALTPTQKAQLKLEREARKISLNRALEDARNGVWEAAKQMHAEFQAHSSEYYYRLIMQASRITSKKRRTSRWNAYLSKELQRRNAGAFSTIFIATRSVAADSASTDVPEGEDRKRVSDGDLTREIARQWKSMSEEEQIAATDDTLKELQERQEDHMTGTHTVPIHAFHDARATVATIEREVQ